MSLEPGWDQVDSISTDDTPVALNGYESIYDTGVAFKLVWDASQSPLNVPWEAFTLDQWFYQSHQFLAGQQGEEYFLVPARLYSPAEFTVQAFDPQTSNLLLERSHTESIVEISTGFEDYLSNCPVEPSMVKDWSVQGLNAVIGSLISSSFTSEAIEEMSMQTGYPVSYIENSVNSFESAMKQQFRPLAEGWVDSAYGIQNRYVIRVGGGHPLRGDTQSALGSIPQGMNSGLTDLLAPGQVFSDIIPQIAYINFNTGALTQFALDGFPSFLETGEFPTISSSTVFVTDAGLHYPVEVFSGGDWAISGGLDLGVQNVSFSHIGGGYVGASLSVIYQTPTGIFFVNGAASQTIGSEPTGSLSVNGGWNY